MQLEASKADGRERTRGEKGELRPAVQQRAASNHDGGGYNEQALHPRVHIPANPNPRGGAQECLALLYLMCRDDCAPPEGGLKLLMITR